MRQIWAYEQTVKLGDGIDLKMMPYSLADTSVEPGTHDRTPLDYVFASGRQNLSKLGSLTDEQINTLYPDVDTEKFKESLSRLQRAQRIGRLAVYRAQLIADRATVHAGYALLHAQSRSRIAEMAGVSAYAVFEPIVDIAKEALPETDISDEELERLTLTGMLKVMAEQFPRPNNQAVMYVAEGSLDADVAAKLEMPNTGPNDLGCPGVAGIRFGGSYSDESYTVANLIAEIEASKTY